MPKKKYKKPSTITKAKEPTASYGLKKGNKPIHFFSSLDEMAEDNYKWLASLTPEEHLRNATALIKRIFAEDLKKHPKLGNKLYID